MVRTYGMDNKTSGSFNINGDTMKYFLIYSVAYFGDTLMTNSLCLNLKKIYPNCYIVYIVNKNFYDVAINLEGVNEVWIYDKHGEHKGLNGIFSFIKKYKGKYKFDSAFVTFAPLRGVLISKILGAEKIYTEYKSTICRPFISNKNTNFKNYIHIQDRIAYLGELYSKKPFEILKIKYNIPKNAIQYVDENLLFNIKKPFVILNPITKNKIKDFKKELITDLVTLIDKDGYIPIMTGIGQESNDYYNSLPELTKNKLLNFSNKTTIPQLAALLKRSSLLISADTGTAHLALATNTPLIDIFYRNEEFRLKRCAPKSIYNAKSVTHKKALDSIYIWEKGKEIIKRRFYENL